MKNKLKALVLTAVVFVSTMTSAKADVYIYGGGQWVGTISSPTVHRVISFSNRALAIAAFHRLLRATR